MKKLILLVLAVFSIFSIKALASEVVYKNVITDETTIEEDFKVLGMDINDYYTSTSYNKCAKFYVVGMSEAYVDGNIQTYFYIYNPAKVQEIEIDSLDYAINGNKESFLCDYYSERSDTGLYKVKGFLYLYTKDVTIEITKISGKTIDRDNPDIFSDPQEHIIPISSESGFKANNSHSLFDNSLTCELNYNSTIIIHEMTAIDVKVDDDYFEDYWKHFWHKGWGLTNELHLVFYNFNFPKDIEPDAIKYARFSYNYMEMLERWDAQADFSVKYSKEILSSETLIQEYKPGTRSFNIDGNTQQLEFQTFVLGNRVENKEFGTLIFTEEQTKEFNYDCSILLDANIYIKHNALTTVTLRSFILKEIELLELHYMKDGIIYKCQVVSKPIDPKPINPEIKEPWYIELWKVMIKIGQVVLKFFGQTAPEFVCGIVGSIITGVGILVSPLLIGLFIKLIKVPFKIIDIIFGG